MNTREAAVLITEEVLDQNGKSHVLIQRTLQKEKEWTGADRRFFLRLTEGTIEKALWLDYRINQVSSTPVKKMKPLIRNILRVGAYQIFCMDGVPVSAACNEAVKLAKKRKFQGLSGFVNGVLRSMAVKTDWGEEPEYIRCSLPEWLWDKLLREQGEKKAEKIAGSFLQPEPLTVRCNLSRESAGKTAEMFRREGIECTPSEYLPEALILSGTDGIEKTEAFRKGLIQVQDVSSMLAVKAAGIRPGMHILDVCSAPGGKTLHCADLLQGQGSVRACDLTEEKAALIRENRGRSGFPNIEAVVRDARKYEASEEAKYDVVIADLPCSGLGVAGRKPEIRYRMTQQQICELAELQRDILKTVWRYVKTGGILVYSTCTITSEENEENYQWICRNLPMEPICLADRMPEPLKKDVCEGRLQLLPGIHACDGFFVSAFRRKE